MHQYVGKMQEDVETFYNKYIYLFVYIYTYFKILFDKSKENLIKQTKHHLKRTRFTFII